MLIRYVRAGFFHQVLIPPSKPEMPCRVCLVLCPRFGAMVSSSCLVSKMRGENLVPFVAGCGFPRIS